MGAKHSFKTVLCYQNTCYQLLSHSVSVCVSVLTISLKTPGLMRLVIRATWYTSTAPSSSSWLDRVVRAPNSPDVAPPNLHTHIHTYTHTQINPWKERKKSEVSEWAYLCCSHGSWMTVGPSKCWLCSLTVLTRSKLFLMGLSGFGQQVVLNWRTSNT